MRRDIYVMGRGGLRISRCEVKASISISEFWFAQTLSLRSQKAMRWLLLFIVRGTGISASMSNFTVAPWYQCMDTRSQAACRNGGQMPDIPLQGLPEARARGTQRMSGLAKATHRTSRRESRDNLERGLWEPGARILRRSWSQHTWTLLGHGLRMVRTRVYAMSSCLLNGTCK